MADGWICNPSACCTEEFHKQLLDLQISVLSHVNLSKRHRCNKTFPLVLVQVCLYQEHKAHQIVRQRKLSTMSISQIVDLSFSNFSLPLTLFVWVLQIINFLSHCSVQKSKEFDCCYFRYIMMKKIHPCCKNSS